MKKSTSQERITISTDNKTATLTPDEVYVVADVLVDGKSTSATEKYTFSVSNSHKIAAAFVKKNALPYCVQNDKKSYIGFSAIIGISTNMLHLPAARWSLGITRRISRTTP